MKRIGNLFNKICDINNLKLADKKARKGKRRQQGVIEHMKNQEENILKLRESLINKTFRTSEYKVFKIREPKEREIHSLPYYPDRIVHHAIVNVLEGIFVRTFTSDTYSCIKDRGIHKASYNLRSALKKKDTEYCLKLDVKKFYENIDHDILKSLLRRKFKDNDLLWLLDEVIDSTAGVPIGNYLSQFFANFYLTYFDHWIKETKRVKHYFRYCDDIVTLGGNKEELHTLLEDIRYYLETNLKLSVKGNHQVFSVGIRGIDFVGYKHYHYHVLLRKSIKQRFVKMVRTNYNYKSLVSYNGWIKHCNGINLTNKYERITNHSTEIKGSEVML